jgi:hypothetical protein
MLVNNWYNEAKIYQLKINRQAMEKWAIVCVDNATGIVVFGLKDHPHPYQAEPVEDLMKRRMLRQAQHDNTLLFQIHNYSYYVNQYYFLH